MKKIIIFIGIGILCVAASPVFGAEEKASANGPHRGFYLGGFYHSMGGPLFHYPGEGEELSISATAGSMGFFAGYDFAWASFGAGARLIYAGGAFPNFSAPEMPGMTFGPNVKYTDPKLSFIFLDLMLSWYPVESGLFGVYGYLGLGSGTESYTLSGSDFPQWNGAKSISKFDYSFGGGVRLTPIRYVSLFGELRLIAGDLVTEYSNYLYSDDTWNYYGSATQSTKYTTMFTFGLSVNF
ncbi:MAG: hypothetical protein ABSF88_04470 [Candidatus Aminicenantales bacterium]|jgi:hypothetical protein